MMDHTPNSPSALYDVLYIGNYTKDTIVTPAGTRVADGGAVNFAAHAAVRLGFKTAVVTRLAREDRAVVEQLAQAKVDCFPTYTPFSTCLRLDYPTSDPDVRSLTVTSLAGAITPDEVRPYQAKAAVIGSSLRGEVGLEVIQALRKQSMTLAADMQGFVRVLRENTLKYEPWEDMPATLACLDILKSDAVEAQYLTGETDLYRAARIYAGMGPTEIVLTHKDGVLVYAQGQFYTAGFYPRQLSGRSGRGDTCLGAYVALRQIQPPGEAIRWAAALTSLKMEHSGPFNGTREAVEALLISRYQDEKG